MIEKVIHNRQTGNAWVRLPQDLPATDGYIAVLDCSRLEEVWWARNPRTLEWESFLVVDCARPAGTDGAAEWMTKYDIPFEVGYETALRWGIVGRGTRVWWSDRHPIELYGLER